MSTKEFLVGAAQIAVGVAFASFVTMGLNYVLSFTKSKA